MNPPAATVTFELGTLVTVPSVALMVVVSAFFNVMGMEAAWPATKFTDVV